MYWLDYSAAKLSGAVIKAAGYGGVIRYIDAPDRLRTKHTNLAEYRDHIAHGLKVLLVMQNTTTDADGGWNAGVANAQRAKAGAAMLGYGGVIFFTNDRTTVPNPAAWRSYLDGAASVLGPARTGAYGFANAMDLAVGHASAFWQAGRRSDVRGHTNFWQDNNTQVTVGGITCDRNLVLEPIQEDDMPLSKDDLPLLRQAVFEVLTQTKGNDGRSVLDGVIQTRDELRDRATEAVQNCIPAIVDAVAARLSFGGGTVDLDALATKVSVELGDKFADSVADKLAARLAS
jgi:hypothetical protein